MTAVALHAAALAWPLWSMPAARVRAPAADAEDTLVAEAAAGSNEAFARLVERHQQALRAFLRRACHDQTLADDLAQDTFLTAWSRIGRLAPGANVGAWLCGIGYNKCLTATRGARRGRERDRAWLETAAESAALAPEDRLALEDAMRGLPLEQRACVALCLAADYSHGETAHALSLPLGTVKSHVARGRARLLAALGDPR